MTIFYQFGEKIYANITNKCPCSCRFCIRKNSDSIVDNDSLWLEHEPSYEEIIEAFDKFPKEGFEWLVFCGYGEPMMRADVLLRVAKYIKKNSNLKIRINTNGLISLIAPQFDIHSLKGVIDAVSISLNASTPDKYYEISKPEFGLPAYNSMLNFAIIANSIIPSVTFTIVDDGLDQEEIEACRERAKNLDIPLRIRHYVTDNENYR